jgi:hypothetical protein
VAAHGKRLDKDGAADVAGSAPKYSLRTVAATRLGVPVALERVSAFKIKRTTENTEAACGGCTESAAADIDALPCLSVFSVAVFPFACGADGLAAGAAGH